MADQKISFSQYQMWKVCPHRWKLNYIDRIAKNEPNIALVFGTVMHEVLQEYVKTIYEKSIIQANELNLNEKLLVGLRSEYKKCLIEYDNVHFSNEDELQEHYIDGVEILKWFKSHRSDFFQKKDYELLGIELPINIIPVESYPNVRLVGFLDLVIKNTKTGMIHIYDFKTSKSGWNKYAKSDKIKIAQLVLYKTYFSEQYGVNPDQISVEYLILKRKIDPDAQYEVMKKRIQRFEPSHGKIAQNDIRKEIQTFIQYSFNSDGQYNLNVIQPPIAGKDSYNCKFCNYKDNETSCPSDKRLLNAIDIKKNL